VTLAASSCSRLADRREEDGLVERHPDPRHRRATLLHITSAGGTDLRFRAGDRPANLQDGDASAARAAQGKVLVDKEIELPAGVVRIAPVEETVDGKPLRRTTTRDFAEASQRLLSVDNLLVFHVAPGRPTRNLYVQMRASFDTSYFLTIIPVDSRTSWKKSKRFNVRANPP